MKRLYKKAGMNFAKTGTGAQIAVYIYYILKDAKLRIKKRFKSQ